MCGCKYVIHTMYEWIHTHCECRDNHMHYKVGFESGHNLMCISDRHILLWVINFNVVEEKKTLAVFFSKKKVKKKNTQTKTQPIIKS